MIREALAELVAGRDLPTETANTVMQEILSGEATSSQIAGFAVAMRMKGETVPEITGLALAMRSAATPLPLPNDIQREDLLDTCGTGGDGAQTFNVSTAVALVAAGEGVQVAKHGNRAVSSRSGSADVLEQLGIRLDLSPQECADCLRETGVAFLFAPAFHGALRHAAMPRKEMGLRTVFNVLGPICNPAGAGRQLVGVFDRTWVGRLATVLGALGAKSACVVHSEDGLDEISVFAPTHVAWVGKDRKVREEMIDPKTHGLAHENRDAITGGDAKRNAELILELLQGAKGPARDLVVLNAGAALVVSGRANTLADGIGLAAASIDHGRAKERLDALVQFCRRAAEKSTEGAGR